jgi:hypothetical protein
MIMMIIVLHDLNIDKIATSFTSTDTHLDLKPPSLLSAYSPSLVTPMSADAVLSPGNPKLLQNLNRTPGPHSESEVTQAGARDAAAAADSESNIQVQVDLEASPSAPELHKEFRNLTLLLRLLTAINGGRPMLPNQIAPHFAMLPRRKESVIDAVTTILVRDCEVVAAASFKGSAGSIICQNLPDIGPQGANATPMNQSSASALSDLDRTYDLDPVIPYLEEDEKEDFKLNVAAVANPDEADKHSFPLHLPNGPMIVLGVNSWPEFATNKHAMLKA